jgi:hypothetical protein
MALLTRRSLLRGLFAAPAIVAVGNIMPVKLWRPEPIDWELYHSDWPLDYSDFADLTDVYDPRLLKMCHDVVSFHATLGSVRSL